ncbi:hypothetical protein HU200_033161 [Digitaria exilis]|uniref:Disease resistance protein At4g27190-like leucine-rich repeats domain-containing protein n=1 Tax=Digitaria exilis TaxID=1010633 RepID=A0A835EPP5_9POAL|nr:hypothetical protein HU200_033161 [Digitaria exilis]
MQNFHAANVKEAVQYIVHYLGDTNEPSQGIYFDGWRGLGASWVLRSVAEDLPPSVRSIFDKVIHIDCSRWTNRRELQRIVVQKLGLPQQVTDILDKQDEEDDFSGSDEGSRPEIKKVGEQIHQALRGQSFLVAFHNGSSNLVNLNNFGIPQPEDQFPSFVRKVLWTFRGRLRGLPGMKSTADEKLVSSSAESTKPGDQPLTERDLSREEIQLTEREDNSKFFLFSDLGDSESESWNGLRQSEATELAQYTRKLGVTKEIAALCCKYMLLLNSKGVDTVDFNWATHASSYWVCDGIIQEYQQDKAWEVATALMEEIRLEDFSSFELPDFGDKTRWIVVSNSDTTEIKPETTSFFCGNKRGLVASLPNNMFQRYHQLHVLKLYFCAFSFSSPPFLRCLSIRYLDLDHCMDQPQKGDENKEAEEENDRRKVEFLHSLLVLDVSYTDWELNLSIERRLNNIREINIKRGRIWSSDHAWSWRHLQNVHKVRVIEPTSPWETGNMEEFRDMVKLELLDLSGNSTIQVLPSLSGTSNLSNLVLDGCIGLIHIGAEALPPSLVTFSFDAGVDSNKKARISHISMAACARLVNFRLRGSFPSLEELDLSNTSVKTLDFKDEVVQVPHLQQLILLGCEKMRAILWPKAGMPKLMVLRIDTRGGTEEARSKKQSDDYSFFTKEHEDRCHAHVSVTDMRFLQSLLLANFHIDFGEEISNANVATENGNRAVRFLIDRVKSLHVHDNFSIDTVIPGSMVTRESWSSLKCCSIERCPRLNTVFTTGDAFCFPELETLWAADLLMTRSIWSKGWTSPLHHGKLEVLHLHLCPRLTFILPLSWSQTLSSLETLRITNCGDLKKPSSTGHQRGELELPKLKHIYLHDLPKLHQICGVKIFAPVLETIWKDWWENLEWEGTKAHQHPSLFKPRHSKYYRQKNLLRGTVLR